MNGVMTDMTMWLLFAVLASTVAVWVVLPMLRRGQKRGVVLAFAVAFSSIALYVAIGQSDMPDQPIEQRRAERGIAIDKIREGLAQLEAQLAAQPDDVAGWWLVAQSHEALGDKAGEKAALQRVIALLPDMAPIKGQAMARLEELKAD